MMTHDENRPVLADAVNRVAPGVVIDNPAGAIDDGAYGLTPDEDKPDFIRQEERGWRKLVTLSGRSSTAL